MAYIAYGGLFIIALFLNFLTGLMLIEPVFEFLDWNYSLKTRKTIFVFTILFGIPMGLIVFLFLLLAFSLMIVTPNCRFESLLEDSRNRKFSEMYNNLKDNLREIYDKYYLDVYDGL